MLAKNGQNRLEIGSFKGGCSMCRAVMGEGVCGCESGLKINSRKAQFCKETVAEYCFESTVSEEENLLSLTEFWGKVY